jgi:membrane-associated phospholipid phosphatase
MSTDLNRQAARWLALGVVSLAGFAILGEVVRTMRTLSLDEAFLGQSTAVAWRFTECGYWQALLPVAIVVLLAGVIWRRWLLCCIFSVASLLVSWQCADLFQRLYRRPRPEHWLIKHETAFSYPSSHVVIAVAFYGLWAYLLLRSDLSPVVRRVGALLLLLLGLGIAWSRLALGAHHVTDVIGSLFLGMSVVALGFALCGRLGLGVTGLE